MLQSSQAHRRDSAKVVREIPNHLAFGAFDVENMCDSSDIETDTQRKA